MKLNLRWAHMPYCLFCHAADHIILSLCSVIDIKSAFSVRNPTGGPKSGTITFTHLITDIGGHYDRATGKFTCQYPGIYVFSLNIVKADGEATAVCYIRKNDNNMASVAANPFISSGWFGSSNTVVFHLLSGDVVHLESCTPAITMSSGYTTTFSGFLLQAD